MVIVEEYFLTTRPTTCFIVPCRNVLSQKVKPVGQTNVPSIGPTRSGSFSAKADVIFSMFLALSVATRVTWMPSKCIFRSFDATLRNFRHRVCVSSRGIGQMAFYSAVYSQEEGYD